jgi:hypothetical protein
MKHALLLPNLYKSLSMGQIAITWPLALISSHTMSSFNVYVSSYHCKLLGRFYFLKKFMIIKKTNSFSQGSTWLKCLHWLEGMSILNRGLGLEKKWGQSRWPMFDQIGPITSKKCLA